MKKSIFVLMTIAVVVMMLSCEDSNNPSDSVTKYGTVKDIDGNVYKTVKISNQWWICKNLEVTHYRNGDSIPHVTEREKWANLTTGAWCYYDNDSTNGEIYGKLYNWYAVNDPRGLAPEGWHVPSNVEWTELENCLGGYSVAGGKLKETGTTLWEKPNIGATNESGFSALPGGYRHFSGPTTLIGTNGFWWSAGEFNALSASSRSMQNYDGKIGMICDHDKVLGFSVRCVIDSLTIRP